MKLYDVIRKDYKEKGIDDPEPLPTYTPPPTPPKRPKNRSEKQASIRKIAVIAGALVFIALLYWIGIVFVHAKVVINQRHIPFSLQDAQIQLVNSTTADPGRLSFQTMVVTDSVSRQVFGSASSVSTTKASGKAVIINQYSKNSQTLKSGTTLTAANGEKYITQAKVVVPGYTGSGTKKNPGSISVAILAAAVGPAYNSTGTTFTVSGYGGANAKLFYATSAGAINGGQNGAIHTLTDADKQQAIITLQTALSEKLSRETRSQIPPNLITFPDLQFTSIDPNNLVLQGDTIQFTATMQGTMVSYLLPRDLLEQTIASKAISDQVFPSVTIPELGNIQVEPVTPLPSDANNVPDNITVSVSGQGTIIPQVSPDTITQAVLGIPRGTFNNALSTIPEIDTASYSLYPFWAPDFPYKADRITVEIN